jgi:hypothetical protein
MEIFPFSCKMERILLSVILMRIFPENTDQKPNITKNYLKYNKEKKVFLLDSGNLGGCQIRHKSIL